jgi:amidase
LEGFLRKVTAFLVVSFGLTLNAALLLPNIAAQTRADLTGEWVLTTVIYGQNLGERLTLRAETDRLSGSIHRDGSVTLEGSVKDRTIQFHFKESDGTQNDYEGRAEGEAMTGDYTLIDSHREKTIGKWSARRIPPNPSATPRRFDFVPREFHRQLSSAAEPVLHIWPGDTVHTTSVDAGGADEHGVTRVLGGNPLTGPFYIEGAMPGDVLAISINRLRLNRDWAGSDTGIVDRAVTPEFSAKNKIDWSEARWHLDIDKGLARPEKPSEHLANFVVPVHPMLGCVGVAPGFAGAPISTGDSGDVGGNMDFNQITQGTTVYLSVNQPGALLYLGDAHALQGDGELNGNALETSMDIEFSVSVLPEKNIGMPRAETSEYLMALSYSGSLDGAFRNATSELANWLQSDYKLSTSEVAQVLGTSIQYNIAEVADRNVGLVAKIDKRVLAMLKKEPASK